MQTVGTSQSAVYWHRDLNRWSILVKKAIKLPWLRKRGWSPPESVKGKGETVSRLSGKTVHAAAARRAI